MAERFSNKVKDIGFNSVAMYNMGEFNEDYLVYGNNSMKDVVHYHNTSKSFAALLYKAKEYTDSHPEQPKLITVNVRNEWVEGSYLLPDIQNGFCYLKAVKDVMSGEYES